MKNINEQIKEMLTENTGQHMMDSGGDNGRMYQRNEGKDFDSEPRVKLEYYNGLFEYPNVSTYHYLTEVLSVDEISESITDTLRDNKIHYCNDEDIESLDFEFNEYGECYPLEVEFKGSETNTYNHENNLSQVLLFRIINVHETPYVLLQIHGGADVRGGYTNVRCFKLEGYLTGNVDISGYVNETQIDNGYNGYSLTTEEGEDVEIKESDELMLDFCVMEETYMYTE